MLKVQILPSLLAADVGRLEEACIRAEKAGSDGLHLDIMDGHFVRNLSMGPEVVRMARRCVKIPLSVHLMVTRPDWYAETFMDAGADVVLIHVEAQCDPLPVLRQIRKRGVRAGITLNPETPADAAYGLLNEVDEILCMTVHPGFGGQDFIPQALPKIAALRKKAPDLDLSVDGGLDADTCAQAAACGANVFLIGTTLFNSGDMARAIQDIRSSVQASLGKRLH